MLLVAGTPRANQERFLVYDDCCTWWEFLTPLLGEWAEWVPDLQPAALQNHTASYAETITWRQLASHLISDVKFLELINQHPVLGPIKKQFLNRCHGHLERLRVGPDLLPSSPVRAAPPVHPRMAG